MTTRTPLTDEVWPGTDAGQIAEMEMEDEYLDDTFGLIEEEELDAGFSTLSKPMTPRQRVELAREERWLRSMTADFEDIDEFERIESFGDYYVDRFSN